MQKLQEELYPLFNGTQLEKKQQEVFMLLTSSEDGWPHCAMLSVGEILAVNQSELRLGLWKNTQTSQNLKRTCKGMLVIVFNASVYYVKLSFTPLQDVSDSKHPRDRFSAKIIHIKKDKAKYAHILSGIQTQLHSPQEVVSRWYEQISDLKKL